MFGDRLAYLIRSGISRLCQLSAETVRARKRPLSPLPPSTSGSRTSRSIFQALLLPSPPKMNSQFEKKSAD